MRNAGYLNYAPSVTIHIYRQPGANIIETNKRISAQLPFLKAVIPQGIDMTIVVTAPSPSSRRSRTSSVR